MKTLFRLGLAGCLWLGTMHFALGATSGWVSDYNQLLGKYATANGVRYGAWKKDAADMQKLQGVVDGIAKESVSGKSKDEQLAFYLNAYNAWILHEASGEISDEQREGFVFHFLHQQTHPRRWSADEFQSVGR